MRWFPAEEMHPVRPGAVFEHDIAVDTVSAGPDVTVAGREPDRRLPVGEDVRRGGGIEIHVPGLSVRSEAHVRRASDHPDPLARGVPELHALPSGVEMHPPRPGVVLEQDVAVSIVVASRYVSALRVQGNRCVRGSCAIDSDSGLKGFRHIRVSKIESRGRSASRACTNDDTHRRRQITKPTQYTLASFHIQAFSWQGWQGRTEMSPTVAL